MKIDMPGVMGGTISGATLGKMVVRAPGSRAAASSGPGGASQSATRTTDQSSRLIPLQLASFGCAAVIFFVSEL